MTLNRGARYRGLVASVFVRDPGYCTYYGYVERAAKKGTIYVGAGGGGQGTERPGGWASLAYWC